MKIQLIRNATMKLSYAGQTILTDPMFSPKDELNPFAGLARNPTVELPEKIAEIISHITGIMISHCHPDHFDKAASLALPKQIPMFCQPGDVEGLTGEGFEQVIPIEDTTTWQGISLTRTGGHHGKGKILERMGKISGFVLEANNEPTVYWVGDSIWCEEVENTIKKFNPDIIITHSGGAILPGYEAIIMDGEQTLKTLKASGEAKVVAIHMESLDHCTVSREALRQMADDADISPSRLFIPGNGETISFT